jgi:hypothetical protein
MKLLTFLSIAMLASARAAGDEIELPRLPDLFVYRYQPSRRDPFIGPQAKRTIVSGEASLGGIDSGEIVQQYLQTITGAIQRELFIGGLSTGDDKIRSMVVINGVTFSEGDKIPLPVQPEQLIQLQELARSYGLPLEVNQPQRDSINVLVGTVHAHGASIVLPGFKAALCELPFEGDMPSGKVQLERKHTTVSKND